MARTTLNLSCHINLNNLIRHIFTCIFNAYTYPDFLYSPLISASFQYLELNSFPISKWIKHLSVIVSISPWMCNYITIFFWRKSYQISLYHVVLSLLAGLDFSKRDQYCSASSIHPGMPIISLLLHALCP